MIVLSLDPGLTTGAAVGTIEGGRMFVRASQHRFDHMDLWYQLELLKPDFLVTEDFEFRKNEWKRNKIVLYPLELIGAMEVWCGLNKKPLFRQKASEGKSYYHDNVLRESLVWIPNKPHAMDATRHLLHWFTFGWGYQFNTNGYEPEAKKKLTSKLPKRTVYRKP